jgi:hypothetical protein
LGCESSDYFGDEAEILDSDQRRDVGHSFYTCSSEVDDSSGEWI